VVIKIKECKKGESAAEGRFIRREEEVDSCRVMVPRDGERVRRSQEPGGVPSIYLTACQHFCIVGVEKDQ
jgi:hypothetical protein